MHWPRTLAAVASLALLGTLSTPTMATPAGATTSAKAKALAQLKLKALALADMPTGWTVQPAGPVGSEPSCLKDLKKPSKNADRLEVSFTAPSSGPALDQILETGNGASARYKKFNLALASCHNISITTDGTTIHGTVSKLSFSKVGNQSSAYAISFTYEGSSFALDLVLFRVGKYVSGISYEDSGTVNLAQLDGFVTTAVAKIKGKSA
jgi:hypothetical protein